jgi:signal transduction histidine kinase/DNA-binding response OmpR family regulator
MVKDVDRRDHATDTTMSTSRKTVLIAEDSGLQAESLRRGLEDAGYQVVEARNGEQAFALAAMTHPAVVVSDIRMPRMDGYELCRAIRRDGALGATPIILLTELSDPLDVVRALDACADAFVTKPYDVATLVARIEALTADPVARATGEEGEWTKVRVGGQTHEVPVHTPRVVNLLVSTYESAVMQNRRLVAAQHALEYLNANVEQRVLEKTEGLRKRVRELRLLQRASRLLSERKFDRAALEELVTIIPSAWEHSDRCEASITFRGMTVTTPDWQPSKWKQSVTFATSGGTGTIEVAYVDDADVGDASPFLAEEADVLDSLAELLVTYAERDLADARRKSLETQLRHSQKMEALGTLAGGIAHDFNNVLTAIGGNAQLALMEQPADSVREYLHEINAAFLRARSLVKRILVFSRRQESEQKPVALPPIIEEAITLLGATIPRNVDVVVRCAPGLPMICADASQIHQVFVNLGTNAAHAMSPAGGKLTIDVDLVHLDEGSLPSVELTAGTHVRVTVADTGVGISPGLVDRIFDPFFTTKGHGGTGLGLAVVDGIVRDHKGAITVSSELGRGTTFQLFFPEAKPLPESPASRVEPALRGDGEHIMYVDDEETLVVVMTRLLESLGYRCTGFVDPLAALEAFRADPGQFHAVLADMNMHQMSGLVLARSLARIRPDVSVGIVSGFGEQPALKTEGIRVQLSKPFSAAEVGLALRQLLERGGEIETG